MQAQKNDTPEIAPGLIWRMVDDNAVLVSPKIGDVLVLSPTGTAIWQQLSDKKTVNEIQTYLVEHYIVTEEQAKKDIDNFIDQLSELGLLV